MVKINEQSHEMTPPLLLSGGKFHFTARAQRVVSQVWIKIESSKDWDT